MGMMDFSDEEELDDELGEKMVGYLQLLPPHDNLSWVSREFKDGAHAKLETTSGGPMLCVVVFTPVFAPTPSWMYVGPWKLVGGRSSGVGRICFLNSMNLKNRALLGVCV